MPSPFLAFRHDHIASKHLEDLVEFDGFLKLAAVRVENAACFRGGDAVRDTVVDKGHG